MDSKRKAAWRPILDGEPRARAEAVVTEIAGTLAEPGAISATSLARGSPGLALFFAYLGRTRPGQGHEERASRLLEAAIDAVASEPLTASLYSGFTGVVWASEHLAGPFLDDDGDEDDPNQAIDEALLELLAQSPWRDDHDLINGLSGIAVHALERLPRPSGRECLERLLDRLEETAERGGGRATWRTRPEHLMEDRRLIYPDGYHDVGVAHGVPGVAAVLGRMAAAGIGGGRARALLDETTAWVLDQKLTDDAGRGLFPNFVAPGVSARPARLAWCYGDAGVAAALLAAARAIGDEPLERAALEVARSAAAWPTTREDVTDAGLCHGAAGLAHVFNRIHQTTGDEACADAARRWSSRALDMLKQGAEPSQAGFLSGSAGVGLALLAATSSIEPAWDRLLLASSL